MKISYNTNSGLNTLKTLNIMHHQVSPPDSIVLEFSTPTNNVRLTVFFKQELPVEPQAMLLIVPL